MVNVVVAVEVTFVRGRNSVARTPSTSSVTVDVAMTNELGLQATRSYAIQVKGYGISLPVTRRTHRNRDGSMYPHVVGSEEGF